MRILHIFDFFLIFLCSIIPYTTSQNVLPDLSLISNYISENKNIEELNFLYYKLLKENFHLFTPENIISSAIQEHQTESSSDKISELCSNHLKELWRLLAVDWKLTDGIWPFRMVDAWGKIPSGILSGHFSTIGDFDECMVIHGKMVNYTNNNNITTEFKGRHCMVHIFLDYPLINFPARMVQKEQIDTPIIGQRELIALQLISVTIGSCFPSSCSRDDVQKMFKSISNILPIIKTLVSNCYIYEDTLYYDTPDIAVISLLVLFGILAIVGTTIDFILQKMDKKSGELTNPGGTKGIFIKILLTFSININYQKLMSLKTKDKKLNSLYGFRFMTMFFVILAHTILVLLYNYNRNILDIAAFFVNHPVAMTILNGVYLLSFLCADTFFTISGFFISYQLLKLLDKTNGKFNPLLMYCRHYLRLTPTYAILIGIVSTIVPHLSIGPSWTVIDMRAQYCRKNWWHNILYINNLISYNTTQNIENGSCYGESWYMANDMQFFIIAPFLVFLLWKWEKIGMILLGILSIISMVIVGIITDLNDLPPSPLPVREIYKYEHQIYVKPWTRFGPYIVGIWTGFLIHKFSKSQKIKIPIILLVLLKIGYIIFPVLGFTLIFGPWKWMDPRNKIDRIESLFYGSLHRFLWAICMGWIIFMCTTGMGSIINWIFTRKPFIPLGRITFCLFLVSLELQFTFTARAKHAFHSELPGLITLFLAYVILSTILALIIHLFIEAPLVQLEKLIFDRNPTLDPNLSLKNENNVSENHNIQ